MFGYAGNITIMVTTGKISTLAFLSLYIDVCFSFKLFHHWLFLFTITIMCTSFYSIHVSDAF